MRRITLVTTGGTIEKTYDESSGDLVNRRSIVHRMLEELRLEDTEVNILEVMSKDSLDLTDEDRGRIVAMVRAGGAAGLQQGTAPTSEAATDGMVILHGTDTLEMTGECLHRQIEQPVIPIVLTGAIRPFEMKRSDALQNLTEAIFAAGMLEPGVYCVAHGRALRFPGVRKDPRNRTFVGDL